jgi:hypothetical protein
MSYVILTTTNGNYRHLGNDHHGMRTACGKLLRYSDTLVECPGAVQVGCLNCKRTMMFKNAVALGKVDA